MMSSRTLTVSVFVALLGNFAPSLGSEANAAVNTTRVPASACEPETQSGRDLLELSNGSWVFSGIEEGSVTLWCPVTLSIGDVLTPDRIEAMRMWYRDPDGMGPDSRVTAQLHFRPANSSTLSSVGSLTDSNTSSVTTSNRITNDFLTDHTLTDSLYFVKVTIFRNESLENVAFHGLDFSLDPQS